MSDHLITTAPGLTMCATCRRPVLAAVVGGIERHVDPEAINPEGRMVAAEHGLMLFLLRGSHVYPLTAEHLAGGQPLTVLAAHTCHAIPDRFIDGDQMDRAIRLVVRLLGATPVPTDTPPPY